MNYKGKPKYNFIGVVHPVREEADSIVRDGACFMLTSDLVKACISSRGISETSRNSGFDGQVTVVYTVANKGVLSQKEGKSKSRRNERG